jgi:hypothetical protein
MTTRNRIATAAALIAGAAATPLPAQLASPSTPALGLGDNFTAAARGYAAVAWNPAGLAMAGNPAWSMTLVTPRGTGGMGPVTLAELAEWQDIVVPADVRQRWLAEIQAQGGQTGTGGLDATWVGLQIGPVAVQASTSGRMITDLAPGMAQLVMFGNADAQGAPQTISLAGSTVNAELYSTIGISYAIPFAIGGPGARLSAGITAKYTVGHLLAIGGESIGQATASPLAMDMSFPILHSPTDASTGNGGSGFGLDLGIGYELGNSTFALAVHNIVNTFAWDTDALVYRPGTMKFSRQETVTADFDEQPIGTAPAALRQLVDDRTFRPSFSAGAMHRVSPGLMVTADARFGGDGGMQTRPNTHIGAGAEYRIVRWFPVRAGAAYVQHGANNAGFQYGGGIGVGIGGYNVSVSLLRRNMDAGVENVFMFSLLSVGH